MALNFPAKVYQILENESIDIVRWHENGMAFRILDHGRFEREIIPKYFRHNQLSSVQRQLNLYGFKCVSRGEDKGAFFHSNFKRGDWETVRKITRYIPVKKSFPNESFGDRKPSGDEDYVFHDGSYQNSSSVHDVVDVTSFPSSQNNYYNNADPFALFQSKPGTVKDSDCVTSSDLEWSHYSQMTKKSEEEKSQTVKSAPPPIFKPSVLTSRLGYKFPSVTQMTASSAAGAQQIRDFIIITNNIVRIDPDYDLADALNCTYDFDVGRHSVSNYNSQQPCLPSISAGVLHTKSTDIDTLSPSLKSISQQISIYSVNQNTMVDKIAGRLDRANSMDDFVELCAGLDE